MSFYFSNLRNLLYLIFLPVYDKDGRCMPVYEKLRPYGPDRFPTR